MNDASVVSRPESSSRPGTRAEGALSLAPGGAELSIIVPTFNERENVPELFRRLRDCLVGIAWEAIVVDDDSPDATADLVRHVARSDGRIRCVQRIGRRGLSSACIEGMLASSAPYLAVIDGDLQHDESLLPTMLAVLQEEDLDIVVGSRYVAGGGLGGLDTSSRLAISRLSTRLSRLVIRNDLTDPMSGFFMMRRETLDRCVRNLSAIGFKILVDLFASSPQPLRFKELPYEFRTRQAGASKLDSQAAWDYGMLLLDKLIGHIVPVRFVSFTLVGGLGVLVHFAVLATLFEAMQVSFVVGQSVATVTAMTSNFLLNNSFTYRDMRLRGWHLVKGWLSFSLACSVGALANIGIASYMFREMEARWAVAALAGVVIGAVWNYAVTTVYTWKKRTTA